MPNITLCHVAIGSVQVLLARRWFYKCHCCAFGYWQL